MIGRRALAPFLALAFPPAGARAQLFNPGAPTLAERNGLIAADGPIAPPWTPTDLGAALIAWWDAEQAATITQSGGVVSAWRDAKLSLSATATTTAQPTWNATGFNGRPGVTFDGVANTLTITPVPAAIPTAAVAGEVWAVVDQLALPADATARMYYGYGNTTATSRSGSRVVISTVNRQQTKGGTGSSTTAGSPAVDFSGRHVARSIHGASVMQGELDGTAGTTVGSVNTTATSRFRIGCDAGSTPTLFWNGSINTLLFTSLLDATQAGQMYAYLNGRI